MNVVEWCIMGPSPQACHCFGTVGTALIVFKDGAEETMERWRREERDGRGLPVRRLEEVRQKEEAQVKS